MANWDSHEQPTKQEVDKAHKVTNDLSRLDPEQEIRLVKGGRKRSEYGSAARPALTGCNREESNTLRKLIALKFSGYTQREAFEELELDPSKTTSLLYRKTDAVIQCKAELAKVVMDDLNVNMWMLRGALSEMAPRAVRTLGTVMDSKSASDHAKMKAAVSVLKLVNVDGGMSKPGEGGPSDFLVTLKDNRTGIESDDITIIDAEDVEVLSEDADECSSGVC